VCKIKTLPHNKAKKGKVIMHVFIISTLNLISSCVVTKRPPLFSVRKKNQEVGFIAKYKA
jgi:hypothetical protein